MSYRTSESTSQKFGDVWSAGGDVYQGNQNVTINKVSLTEEPLILDWISTVDVATAQAAARNKARGIKEAGRWILGSPIFRTWLLAKETSILWLQGEMGTGKTVLMSTVIDELINNNDLRGNALLGYFYVDGTSRELSETSTILRSLLRQLTDSKEGFETINDCWTRRPRPVLHDSLVLDLMFSVTKVIDTIVVVDGLDEAKDGYYAVDKLLKRACEDSARMKILVSGRSARSKPLIIDSAAHLRLDSHTARTNVSGDISRYAEVQIGDRGTSLGWPESIQEKVVETIKRKAQGVFRWVELSIDYLCDANQFAIEQALDEIPPSLEGIYDKLMLQIEQSKVKWRRQLASRTFIWLSTALQELSCQELVKAISWDLRLDTIDPEGLQSACNHFVVIDSEHDRFVFGHVSAFEYLGQKALVWDESRLRIQSAIDQQFESAHRHASVTYNCLARLCAKPETKLAQREKAAKPAPVRLVPKMKPASIPFLAYANLFWAFHYGKSSVNENEMAKQLNELTASFLTDAFMSWQMRLTAIFQLRKRASKRDEAIVMQWEDTMVPDTPGPDLLLLACVFNISTIVQECLDYRTGQSTRIDSVGSTTTVLSTSIANLAITQNLPLVISMTRSLFLAAKWAHTNLVHLLLKYGAMDDRELENGQNAIHLAVAAGDLDATQCLLSILPPDVLDLPDAEGFTPVGLAIEKRRPAVLKKLLDYGASVRKPCSRDGALPLHKAAQNNTPEEFEYLLKHAPDSMNWTVEDVKRFRNLPPGSSALDIAVEAGSFQIVKNLLQRGSKAGAMLLYSAIRSGDPGIFDMVIKAIGAPRIGKQELNNLLLIAVSDPRARTNIFGSALHVMVVRLLHEGADPNASDEVGDSCLVQAVRQRNAFIVADLLRAHARVDTKDSVGRTPLIITLEDKLTSISTRYYIIELLLNSGASLETTDRFGRRPSEVAARNETIDKVFRTNFIDRPKNWSMEEAEEIFDTRIEDLEGEIRALQKIGTDYTHKLIEGLRDQQEEYRKLRAGEWRPPSREDQGYRGGGLKKVRVRI